MDIEKYLLERSEAVNSGLKELLPKEDEYPSSLHKAIHYSLFAGGKRLRPVLVLASCEAVGGDISSATNAACAFECIHTYSLIHDDLPAIDNDDLRRGRPTCHKVFGEATAILAGDALLTAAFGMIGAMRTRSGSLVPKIVRELARAAGSTGMIGGQAVDIESEGADIEFPVLEYIHIHKTGELIRSAVRCGAMIGGAEKRELDALTRYSSAIGLAFQIADDVLDVEGSASEMGKNTGGDEKKGKATYPAHIGVEESKKRAGELVALALESIRDFDSGAEPLREIAKYIVTRKK